MLCRLFSRVGQVENIAACKLLLRIVQGIAVKLDPIAEIKNICCFCTKGFNDFLFRPQVIGSFAMTAGRVGILTVGIFSRIETTAGITHIPQDIFGDFMGHRSIPFICCNLEGIKIRIEQLGLIVEHFFKMGYPPLLVH